MTRSEKYGPSTLLALAFYPDCVSHHSEGWLYSSSGSVKASRHLTLRWQMWGSCQAEMSRRKGCPLNNWKHKEQKSRFRKNATLTCVSWEDVWLSAFSLWIHTQPKEQRNICILLLVTDESFDKKGWCSSRTVPPTECVPGKRLKLFYTSKTPLIKLPKDSTWFRG